MVEFLTQYKDVFCILGVAIVQVIILVLSKKRPQIVDNSFVVSLCDFIREAEEKFRIGSDKMNYVLDKSKDYLEDSYNESQVKKMVEYILTLPEKKGK